MYRYKSGSWRWLCLVCNSNATEGHCESERHRQLVILNLNRYRHPGTLSLLGARHLSAASARSVEQWCRQVRGLGLSLDSVRS